MKFYCDSCNTKYSIADEKVRGKVLKVRCKKCENIITVREARTPEAATGSEGGGTGVPQANWYYAVNGVTSGPFDLADVRERFATGKVGDEAYVWHDTFDEWKPVGTVDIFAESLAAGQSLKPRSKTLGFTGKLEAVKAPTGANAERKGSVPRPSTSTKPTETEEPEAKTTPMSTSDIVPRPSKPADSAPSTPQKAEKLAKSEEKEIREDKLAALREKLKAKRASEKKAPEPEPSEQPETVKTATSDLTDFDAAPTSVADPAPADDKSPPTPEVAAESDEAPSFPTPSVPASPSTTSTSDIFEIPAPVDDDELPEEDEDAVPFFPPAAAAPAPNEQSALTGSLLIQLDQIKKKGRGGQMLALGAIVIILLLAGGVGTYLYLQPPMEESTFAAPSGPGSGEHRELNLRRYSETDQKKILELGEEAIEPMEFAEEEGEETSDKETEVAKAEPRKERKPEKSEPAETSKETETDEPTKEPTKAESNKGVAVAAANIKSTNEDGTPTAEATRRKAELFRSATNVKREETAIARPEDRLSGSGSSNNKLTREEALEGMKRVSRSVSLCRERHMRRGGSFDTAKIFVTVTVNGDGRVSDFKAEPATLQNTEFARCMNSHKGRWKFAAFGGEPQPVRRRFIIQ